MPFFARGRIRVSGVFPVSSINSVFFSSGRGESLFFLLGGWRTPFWARYYILPVWKEEGGEMGGGKDWGKKGG